MVCHADAHIGRRTRCAERNDAALNLTMLVQFYFKFCNGNLCCSYNSSLSKDSLSIITRPNSVP